MSEVEQALNRVYTDILEFKEGVIDPDIPTYRRMLGDFEIIGNALELKLQDLREIEEVDEC